jgi:hypothetical protein
MYTEEEAMQKKCQQLFDSATGDRWQKCEASACMAWRWGSDRIFPTKVQNQDELVMTSYKVGYCGLAGKP